ncbi:hypothetical protein KFL_001200300 [Klebsormidium nitens]|uniref:Uncharacterized protein n=1 Tax=Klebsormidium nitens TaxID=105231 RepID=A0A1Y1I1T7_KLENI|nr:hypothetical protein KFL_001200300 [Klebsormidium nitens]|eukprot:GAQ82706.1 hypothetical protein KFL_001200300 [Klebsormidium nitens]
MALRSVNAASQLSSSGAFFLSSDKFEKPHLGGSASAARSAFACHELPRLGRQAALRNINQPESDPPFRTIWKLTPDASKVSKISKTTGRRRLKAAGAASTPSSDTGALEQPETSTSENDAPGDENTPSAAGGQNRGVLTSLKDRFIGKEAVKDFGFLGELPASFRVLLGMGPVYALGLILLQSLLWFIQEMIQVATVKLIRALDPPALIIVNKLSVFTALAFLLLNMSYLALATGLSITAVTRTVAATLSHRPVRIRDTLRDWWAHARPLAMTQLKVYWPLLLVVVYAGLEGDRFLDDTRTRQLELIQEMKILNRINPLTLVALYPGLRLLRIASWFSYFFYALTVLPLLGVAGPAILLENVSSKQAVRQRRFVHPPSFPLYRLLPLLTPIAVMLYFTFFTKAPLPISTVTVVEWSHQARARLGKAAWLVLASVIQVLLYISYRKAKEGDAFGSTQLGAYVGSVDGQDERGQSGEGGLSEASKEGQEVAEDETLDAARSEVEGALNTAHENGTKGSDEARDGSTRASADFGSEGT